MNKLLVSTVSAVTALFALPARVLAQEPTLYDYTYTTQVDDGAIGSALLATTAFPLLCACVIWLVFIAVAVWVYKDAKKHNASSPILWFLLTFFLGLIGLVLYLLLGRRKGESTPATPVSTPASESVK